MTERQSDQSAVSPSFSDDAPPNEPRNFWILVIYQVVLRAGWIFKTESVVMPHAADALDPSGLARGWLPLLNRFGQSVPPVLAARRVKNLPKKQRAFMATTAAMTLCFLGLTTLWIIPGATHHWLAPIAYLILYALFFAAIGVNQLAYNTIQGKLIRPTRRGRLLMIADFVGATSAMICAATLLLRWLHDDGADYAAIFGFTTCLFAAASAMSWFLKELPDDHYEASQGVSHVFRAAWQTIADDANFRRLAIVAGLFSTTLVLFPHYQALAREKLNLGTTWLVWWVVAQNAGTALFSLLVGPIADRRGNRLALRIVTLLIVAGPLAALTSMYFPETCKSLIVAVLPASIVSRWPQITSATFSLVFLFVGLTPVAQKTFNNYTLEITEPEHHPRYLSTLGLSMALPIFVSPLISPLITLVGFERVYLVVVALLLVGWCLTFRLCEPRHRPHPIILADDSL